VVWTLLIAITHLDAYLAACQLAAARAGVTAHAGHRTPGPMRDERRHMVLVTDQRGSTVGLITLEDLLEELVGEIETDISPPLQARVGASAAAAIGHRSSQGLLSGYGCRRS
jgi:hypothetical protein